MSDNFKGQYLKAAADVMILKEHIKQLEQDLAAMTDLAIIKDRAIDLNLKELAEAKKSIKSVIQHYEDDKVYFERHGEAFYTDSFENLMDDIYKKHDEAALAQANVNEQSQAQQPTSLNDFIQKHVHVDGNDSWTYNSLASSAQDFVDSAVEAFVSQAQQPEYTFDQLTKMMMQAATKEGHKVTMKIKWAQPPATEGGDK